MKPKDELAWAGYCLQLLFSELYKVVCILDLYRERYVFMFDRMRLLLMHYCHEFLLFLGSRCWGRGRGKERDATNESFNAVP